MDGSTTPNSQKVGTIKMSIDRQISKPWSVHTSSSHGKEGSVRTHSRTDAPWKRHVRWEEARHKTTVCGFRFKSTETEGR